MRRWLLYSMFFILLADSMLGLKLGIGLGLSVKNLYLYALCGVLAVSAALHPGDLRITDADVHVPFMLLIVYAMISWFIRSSFDPTYSGMRGLVTMKSQLVDLYLFFLVFRYVALDPEDVRWLLRAIVGTLLATSLVTLMDYLNLPNLGIVGTFKGRVEGPVGAANEYGALLAFLLPIAICLVPVKRGWGRRLWQVGLISTAFLLVATGSRGAYVSVVLGSLAAAFYLRQYITAKALGRYAGLGLVLLAVSIAAALYFSGDVLEEVTRKSSEQDVREVSSGRTAIWGAALALMSQWPFSYLVGFGWNTFDSSGIWKSAHSVYVNFLFELGVVGLLLFLWLLVSLLLRTRRALPGARLDDARAMGGYIVGLFSLMIAIAFVEIPVPANIVWMLTGLLSGLVARYRYVSDAAYKSKPRTAEAIAAGRGR